MTALTAEPVAPRNTSRATLPYLLHDILRLLAADDCEIVITTENAGPAVKAARDLLRAFGIEPDMEDP